VLDIPRRLREVTGDRSLKVYFNTNEQLYEVWGVDSASTPYLMHKYPFLDARVEFDFIRAYWRAWRTGNPYRELLRKIDERECQKERNYWKSLSDMEYKSKDVTRFAGTPVVQGWSDGNNGYA
jgi:sulfur relay (sulfurtransferase) DsrC/TusE family protein